MKKSKTLNIRNVGNVEAEPRWQDSNFTLAFWNEQHRVVLHLERHYIEYIAANLWKIVRHEEQRVAAAKAALSGDQP